MCHEVAKQREIHGRIEAEREGELGVARVKRDKKIGQKNKNGLCWSKRPNTLTFPFPRRISHAFRFNLLFIDVR